MMYNEPNLHSRNLKLISLMFILYYLLGLEPVDNSIRLQVINFQVTNLEVLPWVAHGLLLYFAWRFYLNSRKRVRTGYRRKFAFQQISSKDSFFHRRLKNVCLKDFLVNHKSQYETEIEGIVGKDSIDSVRSAGFNIYPNKFSYENQKLVLVYGVQYQYESELFQRTMKTFSITYSWYSWPLIKSWRFLAFSINTEDAPDFLLPWLLFFAAILTSALNCFGISANTLG
ncbi:hypothetical protein DMX23_24705 [Vibrio parahaemolyticus]|nr:hypothetical protein [Vibrio parahaemolyticus]